MENINWQARAERESLTIHNVINGEAVDMQGGTDTEREKYAPRDGRLLYHFRESTDPQVDQAVAAARAAFTDGRWHQLPIRQRATILNKYADLIEANRETLALYDSLDVGMPITRALTQDIGNVIHRLRAAAAGGLQLIANAAADLGHFSYHRYKPVGVVGGILGWNFPASLAATKLGPALIMGNSLVLKPSEFTPLSTPLLATLALEAGIPPGVVNVVQGAGRVGAALARHPDVDLIGFVGSSATGKRIMAAAGESNMKRVVLECGGKSPFIVFDDCPDDLDALAQEIIDTAFPNQGALCVAGTRLIVQQRVRDRLMPLIIKKAAALKPADPLDPNTTFGAIINEAHMNKVLGYIESGMKEGADLILGGERAYPEGDSALKNGFYIPPTIFDNVPPKAKIAQEEIFGPVLSTFVFETEEEAIELANNSQFGLAAYAATTNLNRAQRLGQRLNSGSLYVLATSKPAGSAPTLASDKQRQSGFGFSGGTKGLEEYAVTTTVHLYT
jgi:acyl-CoA reductase-like NAD-dependent aldehyde dehydrogenase